MTGLFVIIPCKCRRRLRLLVARVMGGAALAFTTLGGAEERKATAWQSTQWAQIEAAWGLVNLDGTLRLNFALATGLELKHLGIRFELEHGIETDAAGRARSIWRVKGLQSSLVPSGRAQLRWQPLAGATVEFVREKIGRALADAGSTRWLIRESAPDEYEIRSLDGRAWRYRHGGLVSAEHPALGELRFTTQGAWITRIQRADAAADEPPLLQADYDESGRLMALDEGGPP